MRQLLNCDVDILERFKFLMQTLPHRILEIHVKFFCFNIRNFISSENKRQSNFDIDVGVLFRLVLNFWKTTEAEKRHNHIVNGSKITNC